MAHAVEVRLPFLDHRLVTFAFRLESRWKLRGEYTKFILRAAMQGRIPEIVRTRAQKFGFPTSANKWLHTVLFERCRELLASRSMRESGVWNIRELDRALSSKERCAVALGDRLFDFVQFALWYGLSRLCVSLISVPALSELVEIAQVC
jgi:asparagine synthase (glutamine-hydrolysing)